MATLQTITLQTITSDDVKRCKRLVWEITMMILQCEMDRVARHKRLAEYEKKKQEVENMKPKRLIPDYNYPQLQRDYLFAA